MSINVEKKGIWLYDGVAEKPVDIISLNYDWWFSIAKAEDALEPNEEPEPMNSEGVLYYVRFENAGEASEPTWVNSQGYHDIQSAIVEAESTVTGTIKWQ